MRSGSNRRGFAQEFDTRYFLASNLDFYVSGSVSERESESVSEAETGSGLEAVPESVSEAVRVSGL